MTNSTIKTDNKNKSNKDHKPLILVTAANGNTGFPAAKTLLELGFRVRAFVRDSTKAKAQELESLGAELFVGDIEDIRDTRKALEGVQRAYFVPTYPNVLFQGETFATAVEEEGLEHVVVLTQWLASNTHPSIYTKEHWLVDQTFKRLSSVNVTFINPGLFAFVYFLNFEITAQFGIMPEFGKNAPPSNEDIGATAAHILKDPTKHINKTYRITGPEVLTSQQIAETIGQILGRKIKVQNMPEKMMMKVFKAYGWPIRDYSQLRYYIQDAQGDAFALGGTTNAVKEITGNEAEDFETIARRYIKNDLSSKQSLSNKLRAMKHMMGVMLTSAPHVDEYEKEASFPKFKGMEFSANSKEWQKDHAV